MRKADIEEMREYGRFRRALLKDRATALDMAERVTLPFLIALYQVRLAGTERHLEEIDAEIRARAEADPENASAWRALISPPSTR